MKVLFPAWTSAKADEAKLTALHDLAVQFLVQGVHPDMSAGQMQLLTAKLPPKDLSALKKTMLRPGFVDEWNHLDSLASGFAKVLLSKQNAKASAGYKLFMSYDPEAILWLGFISKDKAVQERFNLFLKVWPEARQRIPYLLMQEMRITPELSGYAELVQNIFLELIDGHLITPEETRAYLEPHSPPAPPPQVTIKRSRAKRAEAKIKEQAFDEDEEDEDGLLADDDLEATRRRRGTRSERSAQGCPCRRRRRVRVRRRRRRCGRKAGSPVWQEEGPGSCPGQEGVRQGSSSGSARQARASATRGKREARRRCTGKGYPGPRKGSARKGPSGSRCKSETDSGQSGKARQTCREEARAG